MRQREANQAGDLHWHEVLVAPMKDLQTNKRYNAKIHSVRTRRGKFVIRWTIYPAQMGKRGPKKAKTP